MREMKANAFLTNFFAVVVVMCRGSGSSIHTIHAKGVEH